MKLTAERIGLPITSNLNSPLEVVKFYRGRMRAAAKQWRLWADTRCEIYKADALRTARWNRDAANFHAKKITP